MLLISVISLVDVIEENKFTTNLIEQHNARCNEYAISISHNVKLLDNKIQV